MKTFVCMLSVMMFLSCSPNKDSDKCSEPGSSCSNCARIYDENDNFVTQAQLGGTTGTSVLWNGKDCKGNKVSCGAYKVVMHYQGATVVTTMLVADSNSVSTFGRESCDSLKKACGGTYYENTGATIYGMGDVECMCCQ